MIISRPLAVGAVKGRFLVTLTLHKEALLVWKIICRNNGRGERCADDVAISLVAVMEGWSSVFSWQ